MQIFRGGSRAALHRWAPGVIARTRARDGRRLEAVLGAHLRQGDALLGALVAFHGLPEGHVRHVGEGEALLQLLVGTVQPREHLVGDRVRVRVRVRVG